MNDELFARGLERAESIENEEAAEKEAELIDKAEDLAPEYRNAPSREKLRRS